MDELTLYLQDQEWPLTYTDHDRQIVRAIAVDDDGCFILSGLSGMMNLVRQP